MATSVACGGPAGNGPPDVRDARALDPLGSDRSAFYVTLTSSSPAPDTLLEVRLEDGRATLHETTVTDGMMRMRERSWLELPAYGTLRLAPGGAHAMIEGLTRPLTEGDSLDVVLRFARAGDISVRAIVISPSSATSGA